MFIEFIKRVGERDDIRGLPSIISLFHSEFNKFNYAKARMLDSIYIMLLKLLCSSFFMLKRIISHYVRMVVMDVKPLPLHL